MMKGLVFSNARRLDVLRTHVFNTVIFSLMEIRLMAHGIYRSHFIYSGSNGTASVTVDITICYLEKKTDRKLGHKPEKYHGKWPFKRMYGIQEPVSLALCALNLAVQFHGWVSFFILVNYKLPYTPNKKTYYQCTGLWHIYAIFAMNSWFWTAVFLSRDVELTEKLHYSSAVALHGCSLFLAIIRAFSVRVEAIRVMVAAPVFAFLTTHILYLNFYEFD